MLIPTIRRSVLCNLRRIAACVTYRNKTRMKTARQCSESNLLSISSPNIAAYRIYSTKSDAEPQDALPMLVTDAKMFTQSLLTPFRLLFLSFTIIPHIDKEFVMFEILKGAKYAITVISKALANKDYDSLEGLVAEDMIEILRTKIETLNPEQRQLIAVDEEDIMFHVLSDIAVVADEEEHSIEFKMILHYTPEKRKLLETDTFLEAVSSNLKNLLVCNYTFTRKYVNNVGGPWIATFVNHYSINIM